MAIVIALYRLRRTFSWVENAMTHCAPERHLQHLDTRSTEKKLFFDTCRTNKKSAPTRHSTQLRRRTQFMAKGTFGQQLRRRGPLDATERTERKQTPDRL